MTVLQKLCYNIRRAAKHVNFRVRVTPEYEQKHQSACSRRLLVFAIIQFPVINGIVIWLDWSLPDLGMG